MLPKKVSTEFIHFQVSFVAENHLLSGFWWTLVGLVTMDVLLKFSVPQFPHIK